MRTGVVISFILHFFLIIFLLYILPHFFSEEKNLEISVEIVTIEPDKPIGTKAKKSTVKEPQKDERKLTIKSKPQPKPKPKEEAKKAESQKKEKPKTKQEPVESSESGAEEEVDEEFNEVLAEMERLRREEEIRSKTKKLSKTFPGLTQGEKNMVRGQVYSCWRTVTNNIFAEEDLRDVKIRVRVYLAEDGTVKQVKPLGATRNYIPLDNVLYRQLVDSTINAFYRCNKIENLPQDKYEYWQEFEFIFDPSSL